MEIEKHINNLKDYIRIDKENIVYDDSDFSEFCRSHCKDIQAVLDELDRRIKPETIEENLNDLMKKLEIADLSGFYDEVKDIKENLLN